MAWQDEWKNNITTMEELRKVIPMTDEEYALIGEEAGKFPMSISRYYASLIDPSDPDDPIRKMSVPSRSVSGAGISQPLTGPGWIFGSLPRPSRR